MPLIINGETLADHVLDRELLRLSSGLEMDAPYAGGSDPALLRTRAARNLVARTLLLQTAAARRIRVTAAEVEAERRRRWGGTGSGVCGSGVLAAIEQDMLLARTRAHLARHVPRPGRAEVERYYSRNRQRYFLPEAVEAAHIFRAVAPYEDGSTAEAVLREAEEELGAGKPFAHVANRYSDCKGVGGSVGWVTRGATVQAFEDVVFTLEVGRRSSFFRTVFGWHIAIVTRRRKDGHTPLESVRLEIANEMLAVARESEVNRALAGIEAESDIRFIEGATHG